MTLPRDLQERIARIAADRLSGATALVLEAIEVLRRASHDRAAVREAAVALVRGQPSMAGFRTAAAVALGPEPDQGLAQLERRLRIAPAAAARLAVPLLQLRRTHPRELTIVTCSRSALVERTLLELGHHQPVRVCCAESRPGLEGEQLAAVLATAGLRVDVYTDAAAGTAVREADCVLVGADALSRDAFVNKVGTEGLAALGRVHGVSVTVVAGREKILPEVVFQALTFDEPQADERHAPNEKGRFRRRSPLFETIRADLVDQVVLDSGVVTMDDLSTVSLWAPEREAAYMSAINAYNMLDNG
jgi:translation initiation factor 2B subunit (eIF-2B alpha/beta/delta family)